MDLSKMLAALKDSPSTKAETYLRCLCGKAVQQAGSRKLHSGVVNYSELLCGDCRKDYAEMARIVCCQCKRLVGFVKPDIDRVTKFEFRRGAHYHVIGCPSCAKTNKTPVVEHEQWCRVRGIPTVENLDLVQEIEQKRLRIERAADKLRVDLTGVFNTPTQVGTNIL